MTDLMIHLPTINEDWVENHMSELLTDATDFFESVEPQSFEFSIGCLGYAQSFRNMNARKRERFFMSDQEYEAEKESEQHVKSIFESYKLWDTVVATKEDIDTYNEALKEIVFQIADNYARAWAKYMNLSTWEDQ